MPFGRKRGRDILGLRLSFFCASACPHRTILNANFLQIAHDIFLFLPNPDVYFLWRMVMGPAGPQGIRPQRSKNKKAMIIQGRPLINYVYPKRASASLRFFIRSQPERLITGWPVPAAGRVTSRLRVGRRVQVLLFAEGN